MMETVSFKIYLEKEDGSGSEIRRFCIDECSAGTFDAVKQKIRQLYPSLQNAYFNVFWKDNEGDKVAVNCDAEYIVAITTIREEVGDNIVRLYCTLDNSTETATKKEDLKERRCHTSEKLIKTLNSASCIEDDEDSGEVAAAAASTKVTFAPGTLKGLECNLCRQNLDGRLLFKCVTCRDYDLCAKCGVHQSHLEHVMIRIPSHQALARSGIFKVDRLSSLVRRHRRFDFSALIVPLAKNCNAKHFRKIRYADVEVVPPTNSAAAATEAAAHMAALSPASRKLAKYMVSFSDKGGMTFAGVPSPLTRSASFVADEHKARGGEQRKSKEDDKREKKEKKERESCLKRSRSAREKGVRSAKSVLDYWLPPAVAQNLAGTPADDVIKGVVDMLAGVNLSCPFEEKQGEAKQSEQAATSSQPEEAKKPKVPAPPPVSTAAVQVLRELNDLFFADLSRPQNEGNGQQAGANADNKPDSTTPDKKENKPEPPQEPSSSTGPSAATAAPVSPQPILNDNDGIRVVGSSSPGDEQEEFVFVDPSAQGAIPRRSAPSVYPSPSEIPKQESVPVEAQPAAPLTGGQARPMSEKQERVSAALNKMLAMGFTNEGGWLENLLNNHDGSIERVLEILLPSSVFGRVID